MSAAPIVVPAASAPQAPAVPLTAIQVIEKEIQGFFKQREQAVANVNAIEGAIQASQHLLVRLRQEELKAVNLTKSAVTPVETDAKAVLEKALGVPVEVAGLVEKL